MERSIKVPVEYADGRRCDKCRFFGVIAQTTVCRFEPPKQFATFMVLGVNEKTKEPVGAWQQSSFFPITREDQWCGKFEPRSNG